MPANGTVDAALGRSSTNRKKMAVVAEGRGKHAITHYRTIEPLKNATLVECQLETGRTHQVRVHMAHIGHPLVGDPVYGRARKPLSDVLRSEEHTSELQSLMRISYAVFCLKKKIHNHTHTRTYLS